LEVVMESIGKLLIIAGIIIMVIGGIWILLGRFPFIGHLPGDIHITRRHFSFYFPLTISILLSIILTIILNLIFRRR